MSHTPDEFLLAVEASKKLHADRQSDKVRQKLRREGYIIIVANPKRWILTDKGKAHLERMREHGLV